MTPYMIGLIVGIFVGVFVGFVVAGMLHAGARSDLERQIAAGVCRHSSSGRWIYFASEITRIVSPDGVDVFAFAGDEVEALFPGSDEFVISRTGIAGSRPI